MRVAVESDRFLLIKLIYLTWSLSIFLGLCNTFYHYLEIIKSACLLWSLWVRTGKYCNALHCK